ncbi:MAG TPA: hypothetical protein VGI00_22535 [Streptosporangiaceae bacterium]
MTGAVLTSYLGDGGTILGTAVGSGASTAGFAVYKHYLSRTKDKVTPVIVEHARQWTPTGTVEGAQTPLHRDGATRADVTRADLRRPDDATRVDRPLHHGTGSSNGNGNGRGYTAADWDQAQRTAPGWAQPTQAEPGLGPDATRQDLPRPGYSADPTRHDQPRPGYTADPTRQDATPTRTQYGTVRMGDGSLVNGATGADGPGRAGSGSSGSAGSGGSGPGEGRHGKPRLAGRPRWLAPVATAAAVFIVVLIAITFVELGTGKPISSSVWNRSQTGTTLGGSHKTTATPSTTPTPTPSVSGSGSFGATGRAQASPTPSTTPTGAPTPTPSSGSSFGSTPGPTTPATGGAGAGNAGSATVAPRQ